jgi:hypothetical protein
MLRHFACACAALIALASAPVTASAQDRFALVIGNSKYKSVSALENPARDANAIGALLKDAGFQVTSALDLDKASMSKVIRFFTNNIAEKPENTVVLIYFAGHGVQVDGENFLVPVDATIAREADVPLEAMRMADLMAMLETVRSKTRIVILDACRDNPFGDIAKSAPRGLALVNAPAGTLLAYSTSPGHTAADGAGSNSPFAQALLKSAREPGLPIETALKNVRLAVHGTTGGRQTPWEVSALTEPFSFFPGAAGIKPAESTDKTADQWRKELQGMPARDAFALAVRENDVVVYEQYLALYGNDPLAAGLRSILDRRLMMLAWQEAVALNTEAAFAAFLARYPNTDLSATARRLQQRAQSRMAMASVLGGARDGNLIRAAATPGGTCPCSQPGAPNQPANPGAPPPGTRASIPVAPGGPIAVPVGPIQPGGPVIVPSGPVYVPVVPIIPPRITDPGRIRDPRHPGGRYPDPGNRGTDKNDHTKPGDRGAGKGDKPSGGVSKVGSTDPAKPADRGAGKSGTGKPDLGRKGRDTGLGRVIEPRSGNRGRDIGRAPTHNASPRIATPRVHAPRIQAPRFQAPPRGGVIRMGGGSAPRFGGGRPPGGRGGFNVR